MVRGRNTRSIEYRNKEIAIFHMKNQGIIAYSDSYIVQSTGRGNS